MIINRPEMIINQHPAQPRDKRLGIGFWFTRDRQDLPDPIDFYDADWDPKERSVVAYYLEHGELQNRYHGQSECRICAIRNGSYDLGDNKYIWPSGFAHYIRKHGVRPPQEFVDHVWKQVSKGTTKDP